MISELLDEINDMITSITDKNQLIKTLTEDLESKLKTAEVEIANLNYKIDELNSTNSSLLFENESLKKDIEDYKSQADLNLDGLKVAINELKALIYG